VGLPQNFTFCDSPFSQSGEAIYDREPGKPTDEANEIPAN
jgi:hypothetical protein